MQFLICRNCDTRALTHCANNHCLKPNVRLKMTNDSKLLGTSKGDILNLLHVKPILQRCSQNQISSVLPAGCCHRLDTYQAWHHIWKRACMHTLNSYSSQHLTPELHLGLPDMAFSVTLDQVGSLLPAKCSQTTEPFYFLLLRIKLYEDCQGRFDSAPQMQRKSSRAHLAFAKMHSHFPGAKQSHLVIHECDSAFQSHSYQTFISSVYSWVYSSALGIEE